MTTRTKNADAAAADNSPSDLIDAKIARDWGIGAGRCSGECAD